MSTDSTYRFRMDVRKEEHEQIARMLLRAETVKEVARLRKMVPLSEWEEIVRYAKSIRKFHQTADAFGIENAGT